MAWYLTRPHVLHRYLLALAFLVLVSVGHGFSLVPCITEALMVTEHGVITNEADVR